ncbi:hypothetical protein BYT27DRAFT_7233952 [Phlegmacium glaucopus]|nr:hypothetical protein BYT27DRAFT_7233952 [Phlegmacium glaucopus]
MFSTLLFSLIASASAAADSNRYYPYDPYLAFRPAFVRSLPVQIMLTGVVLTLVAVLFIHLMFTAKYHWSLAPVNYVLQLSGVTTLLISLIATMHVVLSASFAESEKWPYMLSYIAVNVPPLDLDISTEGWSIAERATWLVMSASTSGLIQITHIQFMTLLYPSRLERRLIFTLLGPLAIVAATMQLLLISGSDAVSVTATAVRNVCNATLSLLFTISLFIWGLLVNRKQAWRTDGGTAVFGCAALSLALVSTALNFLFVHKEEEFVWLPGLMWAVVLWQSFLGWWWWVGAGSGSGFATEDEHRAEKLRREAKRASRKREAREKKKDKKIKAQKVWQDVTAVFTPNNTQPSTSQLRSRIPSLAPHISSVMQASSPSKEPRTTPYSEPPPMRPLSDFQSDTLVASDPQSPSSSTSESVVSQSSFITTTSVLSVPRALPGVVYRWYLSLRHAHVTAARQQAAERVQRIQELDRNIDQQNPWGWGWGGFGWRSKPISPVEANEKLGTITKSGYEDEQDSRTMDDWRTRRFDNGGEEATLVEKGDLERADDERIRKDQKLGMDHGSQDAGPLPQGQPNMPLPPPVAAVRPSVWWWGPLWRWRLQDSTVY